MPNSGELSGHDQIECEKRPRSSEAKLLGGGWIVPCIPLCLDLSNAELISSSTRGGMEGVEGELVASALGWGSVVLLGFGLTRTKLVI
eukprot:1144122-Pelagomonas_calceolata.AAC.1